MRETNFTEFTDRGKYFGLTRGLSVARGFMGYAGGRRTSPTARCRRVHPRVGAWVFRNDNDSASNCSTNCANNCANNVRNNADFRAAVLAPLLTLYDRTKVLRYSGGLCNLNPNRFRSYGFMQVEARAVELPLRGPSAHGKQAEIPLGYVMLFGHERQGE
jgi:hypothetical protein